MELIKVIGRRRRRRQRLGARMAGKSEGTAGDVD